MLESAKIQRRQSEVREQLASLAANENLTDEQRTQIDGLDKEYRDNEARFRAALIAEDAERREAEDDLEGRSEKEWSDIEARFELRQIAAYYEGDGRQLTGATAEVVQEMRQNGSYKGIPVPLAAFEARAGETVATGTPDPTSTRPIVDRLFADSMASRMGVQTISIESGATEWPVVTSSVSAGWADGELANVAGPTAFATTDKALKPEQTFGVQMEISRKAMKQSGAGLEQAIRRDMGQAIRVGLDQAVFLGTGANGQPLGLIPGVSTYGITATDIDAEATFPAFSAAVSRFLVANAANGPGAVSLMIRPELWDILINNLYTNTAVSHYDRLAGMVGGVSMTSNALAAPDGADSDSTKAILTTTVAGVAPAVVGIWGGVDVIRDPYTLAQSGQVKLTGLLTTDVQVIRPAQIEVLNGLQPGA